MRGHRVLTDPGALREFTQSLAEGLAAHIADIAARTGAPVLVQLDEPILPDVLAARLPTPSGLGTVPGVAEPVARDLLASVIDAARSAGAAGVVVHCCADRPPIALLRDAGADAISFDTSVIDDSAGDIWDELGQAWDAGVALFLGLVPVFEPDRPVDLRELAEPALRLADRLGFNRSVLAEHTVPTPRCGLAGASAAWAKRALTLTAELGKAFTEPPESWGR
jgi:methionine synthase II (cobalamin-independent)